MISAGWDHRVRVFHARKQKSLAILKYHNDAVQCVSFQDKTGWLASGGKTGKIALWNIY